MHTTGYAVALAVLALAVSTAAASQQQSSTAVRAPTSCDSNYTCLSDGPCWERFGSSCINCYDAGDGVKRCYTDPPVPPPTPIPASPTCGGNYTCSSDGDCYHRFGTRCLYCINGGCHPVDAGGKRRN